MLLRAAFAALLLTCTELVSGSSTARNPLKTLAIAKNPSILTQNHRVTAISSFDLAFDLAGSRVRLSLEPNYDIIADGATVSYLGKDGTITKIEPIDRLAHKVFKGTAWLKRGSGPWTNVGWARIVIRRDGLDPLFEGAFTVHHDHHHVQLSSNYKATRDVLDPELGGRDDDYMVVFKDSDIMSVRDHAELKRDTESKYACQSDNLEFNLMPDHPVYAGMRKREDDFWAAPISSLFGKRQIDNPSGGGNSAGVNLVSTIGDTQGCPTTRKVALVGVATDCTYTGSFNNTETARQNVITQMNSASSLYESTFNISLGLANLTVSEASCPGTPPPAMPWNQACSSTVDIQARLNLFSAWRGSQTDSNSHWTLLSTCNTGSAVGLAWLGQACVTGSQSSNSSDGQETVAGANVVVRTSTEWQVIAHETGHTFGAVHDCTSTTCSDGTTVKAQQCCPLSSSTCDAGEQYIMNPSTGQGITKFSPCSIGNICSAMFRNSVKTTCLTNNKGVTTISGQQCGNGIVEEGEDCDCGGVSGCGDNACCDAKTCKFKSGAVCDDSNEDCCKSCQLASNSTVCRVSTGECDPQETCTGTSAYCPADTTKPDGTTCGSSGLKCASGQCTSRDQQCKTVMGSYTQGNDTYACDANNCQLSCASPEFGSGVCYGLQQNFLDGTPCGGGGKCSNGRCAGSSLGKEVKSWIDGHKAIVIGVAAAVGGLLLLSLLGCLYRCAKRRHQRKIYANRQFAPYGAPPPPYVPGGRPRNGPRSGNGSSHRGHRSPHSDSPNGSQGPLMGQPGYNMPQGEYNIPPPPFYQGGRRDLGGAGDIPAPPLPPPGFVRQSSVRYA
ncbi:uncharacterized protein BDZ99DRAFT_422504 [Mytilinidion resinicola]|uniref:Disintegrin and metalloproteinase domain-containing protein B n=1 Tax=Mytilinidion resinicola TaxID=574789 RepID=A0A6A6YC22_9PEZI|nr:uncharacterized protein BDZ99DRAFT_422504 [Mytilinidion resinicola]KAF2806159.1 hypothetical protein BDZ99DRAFT_422504 [Mytilinidion resinicola]